VTTRLEEALVAPGGETRDDVAPPSVHDDGRPPELEYPPFARRPAPSDPETLGKEEEPSLRRRAPRTYRIFPARTTGVPSRQISDPARRIDPWKSEALLPPE
jgi:hypothetical protein